MIPLTAGSFAISDSLLPFVVFFHHLCVILPIPSSQVKEVHPLMALHIGSFAVPEEAGARYEIASRRLGGQDGHIGYLVRQE
jgi:hypothetical protein